MRSAFVLHDGRLTALTGDFAPGEGERLPEGPIDPLIKDGRGEMPREG